MTKQKYLEMFRDKAKGAMYGVAVGDALGAPLEFMSALEIKDKYGAEPVKEMLGGGWLQVQPGETTDDTDMTLAVAEGLMAIPEEPPASAIVREVGDRFIAWYHTRPKDIGVTCKAVIEGAEQRKPYMSTHKAWMDSSEAYDKSSGHKSAGNGALMRTAPVGIVCRRPRIPAITIAEMTHWDNAACTLVADYSQAIANLVRGASYYEIIDLQYKYNTAGHLNPTGYSFDSMRCALEAMSNAKPFEKALVMAVNMGGDADTIGAITGGLAGAWFGFGRIPERWVNALPAHITARLDAFVEWAVEREAKHYE